MLTDPPVNQNCSSSTMTELHPESLTAGATCDLLSEERGQFETGTFTHTCSEACVFMGED